MFENFDFLEDGNVSEFCDNDCQKCNCKNICDLASYGLIDTITP